MASNAADSVTRSWANCELLTDAAPKSIVWASSGDDGSGKSHFGLTAPGPIWVAAFDAFGMNRVSADVKRGKEIRIARYPFNAREHGDDRRKTQDAAKRLWEKFRDDYDAALANARTVLWDREDLYYELQRYANFGAQNDAPKEYGPLYIETAWLITKAQEAGINLGILRGLRDKWLSKFDPAKAKLVPHNTGERIPDGMNKIADHVDVTLMHRWDPVAKAYITRIGKFPNMAEKDQEYPNLTFPDLGSLAYPDSDPESWL